MAEEKKKLNLLGAVSDLLLFILFVGGAGFIGYFVGINQRLAPVQIVAPGTIEAMKYIAQQATGNKVNYSSRQSNNTKVKPIPPPPLKNPVPVKSTSKDDKTENSSKPANKKSDKKMPKKKAKKDKTKSLSHSGGTKYWLASSGHDYTGSSVTVSVNGHPVDQFFGPGKYVDVTSKVKKGANEITFDSHVLPDEYNQYLGKEDFALTLQLVSGAQVKDTFKSDDVLLTFKRSAAEIEDSQNKMNFKAR